MHSSPDRYDAQGPDEVRPVRSPAAQFVRGVGVAVVAGVLVNVPRMLLMPLLRLSNVAGALDTLLLGLNVLAGYAGGRAAGAAGVAHDDGRSQWNMAFAATALCASAALGARAVARRVAAMPHATLAAMGGSGMRLLLQLAVALLLIRFGFAIGTYAAARRAGLAVDDESSGEE